jgi:malonyl CoA-acyl carrier protein transacylase
MEKQSLAVLFPGQGAFYKGVFDHFYHNNSKVKEVFDTVDRVAATHLEFTVSDKIWGQPIASFDQIVKETPDLLQLAMYGVSVATYALLEEENVEPTLLVGHSFGEIAALVSAGAFTVEQGAEIVCHRVLSLRELNTAGGYMAALGVDAHRAYKIVDLLNNKQAAVAVENHLNQTVISGTKEVMDAVGDLCRILQITFTKLNSPYPFHSPLMQPAVEAFSARMRHLQAASLKTPVYSPIMERYYQPEDALTDCLAQHLVMPVKFIGAVQWLHQEGTHFFVESSALDTLSKIVTRILKEAEPITIPTLLPRLGDEKSFENAIKTMKTYNLVSEKKEIAIMMTEPTPAPDTLDETLIETLGNTIFPGIAKATFEAFWADRGKNIAGYAMEEFEDFLASKKISFAQLFGQALSSMEMAEPAPAAPVAVATPAPVSASPAPVASGLSRDRLFKELTTLYATALEYPEEVFSEEVELEGELGIDSVKQTELLARVSEKYNLPERTADFRMSDYHTMGLITDFVFEMQGQGAEAQGSAPVAQPEARPVVTMVQHTAAPVASGLSRDRLFKELTTLYATALEYPEEVFSEEVELEGELGIDSVKQTELLARVSEKYNLPERTADFRMSDYHTMGLITDFVFEMQGQGAEAQGKTLAGVR